MERGKWPVSCSGHFTPGERTVEWDWVAPQSLAVYHIPFDIYLTPELVFLQRNYCYTGGFCKKINVVFSVMNHYYVLTLLCSPWKVAFVILCLPEMQQLCFAALCL
jgi:hypothetical protein